MLHLASRSPRRAELLARLGLDFGVVDLDIPERQGADEAAQDYVRRVAREKAGAGLLQVVAVPGLLPEHVFFTHLAHRRFVLGTGDADRNGHGQFPCRPRLSS